MNLISKVVVFDAMYAFTDDFCRHLPFYYMMIDRIYRLDIMKYKILHCFILRHNLFGGFYIFK